MPKLGMAPSRTSLADGESAIFTVCSEGPIIRSQTRNVARGPRKPMQALSLRPGSRQLFAAGGLQRACPAISEAIGPQAVPGCYHFNNGHVK